MGQFLKSYHVFLAPAWLKVLMYLGYPLVVIGISGWLSSQSAPGMLIITLASGCIVMGELLLDTVVFEGIASKDTNKLEYLKTSVRGMKILRNSVIADAVRRAVTTVVILGTLLLCRVTEFAELMLVVLVTLGCTELGLIVTRSITFIMGKFLAVYLGTVLSMWSLRFILSGKNIEGTLCIAGGFYLIVTAVGRIFIMRRARGSFYDK